MRFICTVLHAIIIVCLPIPLFSQTNIEKTIFKREKGLEDFPELLFTQISGAPRLATPILLMNDQGPLIARGFGLAAPAFWDMNQDGLKDLIIGEFGSGIENAEKLYCGNYLRVYYNDGTETIPHFSNHVSYAYPPYEYQALANGTPYSVDQGCCIGFTPQFIDLNLDGEMDMITGQYIGEVSWFQGTAKGFMPGRILPQEGDPRGKTTIASQNYWLFSSASFGDFTGDGLPDMVTGGTSLRISKNVGTKECPQFSKREMLLDITGKPLKVYQYTADDKEYQFFKQVHDDLGLSIPEAGNPKICPYVVDWDNDGVFDILVTNSYSHERLSVVDFFKGIRIGNEYRFEQAKPLFTARNKKKEFPGSGLRVFVTDYNNDGINDLLIGASVALMRNQFNDRLAWNWETSLKIYGAGKDFSNFAFTEQRLKMAKGTTELPPGIEFDDFITISHTGYVYLMLGKR